MADRSHLSIGEVLSLLRDEFPDVTISKIRFLESQGLVDPERTPSGYRKFYEHDVERLRWILRQQRENFLPLKVIRGRLSEQETGSDLPDEPPADAPQPATGVAGPSGPARNAGSQSGSRSPDGVVEPSGPARNAGPARNPGPARPAATPSLFAGLHSQQGPASSPAGPPGLPATSSGPPAAPEPAHVPAASAPAAPAPTAAPVPAVPAPAVGTETVGETSSGPASPATPAPATPVPAAVSRPASEAAPAAVPPAAVAAGPATAGRSGGGEDNDTYSAEELAAAVGAELSLVTDLKQYGLIAPHAVVAGAAYYDAGAVAIARAAADFSRHGVEARHLRIWRNAADREADLFQQVVLPLLRQRNPQARRQAAETLEVLARAGGELRAALVERALREIR